MAKYWDVMFALYNGLASKFFGRDCCGGGCCFFGFMIAFETRPMLPSLRIGFAAASVLYRRGLACG